VRSVRAFPFTPVSCVKTIKIDLDSPADPSIIQDAVRVLERGGLVCLPCGGTYRILADLAEPRAVMSLMQSKRRTRTAPSLVFIDSEKRLREVADVVDPALLKIARVFWPGPVTILVEPHPDMAPKVRKQLTSAVGRVGVRVPADPLAAEVVRGFGRALLVSSANREARQGAESPAQVRKNFVGRVDLMLDAGDLKPGRKSSVIDFQDGAVKVTREGAVTEADILTALGL